MFPHPAFEALDVAVEREQVGLAAGAGGREATGGAARIVRAARLAILALVDAARARFPRQLVALFLNPADPANAATAAQQNITPHATSMTLWRPMRLAIAYVTSSVATIATAGRASTRSRDRAASRSSGRKRARSMPVRTDVMRFGSKPLSRTSWVLSASPVTTM